ncbi:MAG TPA: enoyl-CoA hydratase-related protein [Acidimicrobiales bacterium]|nr:enoyl-CoA hydratase-related protein [Acidimicrobiales bacterium]
MDTGSPRLRGELEGGILRLTLDNEPRMNALTVDMLAALERLSSELLDDKSVRVVTLTGAGSRAFASGVDLTALSSAEAGDRSAAAAYADAMHAVRELRQATIAVIRGFCLGGGLALALCTDIRMCDDSAEFGIPAARIGLGYPDVEPLLQTVGPGWAAEILFTGRRLSSSEAVHTGIVNRVVAATDLISAAEDLAWSITRNAPLSVAASKVAIREYRKDAGDRNLTLIAQMIAECASSDDYAEGKKAFAERREPTFRGN